MFADNADRVWVTKHRLALSTSAGITRFESLCDQLSHFIAVTKTMI